MRLRRLDAAADDPVGGASSDWDAPRATSAESLSRLSCRSCGHRLSRREEDGRIVKVLPLPSGRWDEVVDYLACYDGQPTVNFSSSSTRAVQGVAFEGHSILALHRLDLAETAVCVLAVGGYGEPDDDDDDIDDDAADGGGRGDGPWRDAVGGATVTCANCCSVLGHASTDDADTVRLLKHRLSAPLADASEGSAGGAPTTVRTTPLERRKSDDAFGDDTIASFVAEEMVRYAEGKAIFVFVVSPATMSKREEGDSEADERLVLRLLSWDTRLGTGGGGGGGDDDNGASSSILAEEQDEEGNDVVALEPIAKVIYQCVDGRGDDGDGSDEKKGSGSDRRDDIVAAWTRFDPCCPPPPAGPKPQTGRKSTSTATGAASVRLHLSREEYNELRESIRRGADNFSRDVSDATVRLKLGSKRPTGGGAAGLSMLPRRLC